MKTRLFSFLLLLLCSVYTPVLQAQIITTFAGNGTPGFSGDGGQATAAKLWSPSGIAIDGAGNVYIADEGNSRIRKVNVPGVMSTLAGDGMHAFGGDGGQATAAQLNGPPCVAIDASGNIFIADPSNSRIRKVTTSGVISTIAGNGAFGFSGDGGQATTAQLDGPSGLAIDGSGNIYIADNGNNRIRKIGTSGIITTFAGNGTPAFGGDGGQATAAQLNDPLDVAVDGSGNIYIADAGNNRIRKVSTSGIISTIAGNGASGFSGDGGQASAAKLNIPRGVITDVFGNIYIADNFNYIIRKVNASGVITTFAGNGVNGYVGDGGPATAADITQSWQLAVDGCGNLYITDPGNNRIREISTVSQIITSSSSICSGTTTTFADVTGGGVWSSDNTSVATVATTGVVTGASGGTAVIKYTTSTGCAWKAVTMLPLPTLSSTLTPPAICDTVIFSYTPTGTLSGTTFNWTRSAVPGISNPPASGTGNPNELLTNTTGAPILVTYAYTMAAPNGCTNAQFVTVSVYPTGNCVTNVPITTATVTTINVSPNPNSGEFTLLISSPVDEQAVVTVTNMVGQKVQEFSMLTNQKLGIKLDNAAGIYFLSAATSHGKYVTKIVLN